MGHTRLPGGAPLSRPIAQCLLGLGPPLDSRLALGTWQGIYLWEHRVRAHRREVALHLLGE